MIYIFTPLLVFSGYLWIKNLSKIFEKRFETIIFEYILIITYAIAFIFVDQMNAVRMSTFYFLVYLIIMAQIIFIISPINLMTVSLFPVLFIFTLRGSIAAIMAFTIGTTTHEVLIDITPRLFIFSITYSIFCWCMWQGLNHVSKVEKQIKLFRNIMKTKHVLLIEVIMLFYILIVNDGRFLYNNTNWYNTVYLTSCVFIFVILCVTWRDALRGADLLEKARYTSKIENQLRMQVEHYEDYVDLMTEYRKFKHDYKSTLFTIQTLIESNQLMNAQNMIHQANSKFKDTNALEPYSQSYLLDAIIKNVEKRCNDSNIRCDLDLQIPEIFRLSELDMLRVLTNLINNAIEASIKIENPSQRYISITNTLKNQWLALTISNQYTVKPVLKYGVYKSTKDDEDTHGIGLQIVREILEKSNGILKVEVDEKAQIFTATVLIQYNQN